MRIDRKRSENALDVAGSLYRALTEAEKLARSEGRVILANALQKAYLDVREAIAQSKWIEKGNGA